MGLDVTCPQTPKLTESSKPACQIFFRVLGLVTVWGKGFAGFGVSGIRIEDMEGK